MARTNTQMNAREPLSRALINTVFLLYSFDWSFAYSLKPEGLYAFQILRKV